LLRPTEEEIQEAEALGIDYEGMNGPQIRDAIHKARRSGVRPSIRANKRLRFLVSVADLLGVQINPGDGVITVKRRIEEHLEAIFAQKGIRTRTRIAFTHDSSHHAGKMAIVTKVEVYWLDYHPMIPIRVEGEKVSSVSATSVALYAYAV
jgi:hypothetical protein